VAGLIDSLAWAIALMLAAGLVLAPRPLFAEAGEAKPSRRLEMTLVAVLAIVGSIAFYALPAHTTGVGLTLAAALMVLAAVTYSDIRYLVIPDLYSVALALLAFIGPLALDFWPAVFGGLISGGLLALVAWAWRQSTEIEGLGFGDVKLAAALGALLGAEQSMWTIALSALAAGAVAVAISYFKKRPADAGPVLIPYGAALSAVGGALLVWSRL